MLCRYLQESAKSIGSKSRIYCQIDALKIINTAQRHLDNKHRQLILPICARFIANLTLQTLADIGKGLPISLCAAPNQVCSQRWARLENSPPPPVINVYIQLRQEEYFSEEAKSYFPFFSPVCFLFPPGRNFHFGTPQTNFSCFKNRQAKKKGRSATHFHTFSPSILSFFSSPFTISLLFRSIFPPLFLASLFPFLPFPLCLPFSFFPFQNFPPNFPRVGDSPTSPTSPTPSYTTESNHSKRVVAL